MLREIVKSISVLREIDFLLKKIAEIQTRRLCED